MSPVGRILVCCGLLLGGAFAGYGQAVVQSVTDSAGYGPRVAPGSLASIFGANLAGSTAQAAGFPLPTTLATVSVTIEGTPVPLLYVSPAQINFQVPNATAAGPTSLIVNAPAGASSAFTFTVLSEAPSIFQYGANRAVAQNGDAMHTLNSSGAPAASGSVITVYLTGQGAVDNPVTDGEATPSTPLATATATATATIGPRSATVQFLGLTPGFAGLAQANIQVPVLPTGDYPLVLTVGGIVSISAVVSVSGTGTFTSPLTLVGTAAFTNTGASSVALLGGNTAYACGANRITIVDVSTPSQPVTAGEFGDSALGGNGTICAINASAGNPYLVDVVGPLADANLQPLPVSLAVFDLSNPRSPQLLAVTATQIPYIVDLSFSGTTAFASTSYFTFYQNTRSILAQTGEFLAFSFASPGAPQLISVLPPGSLSDMNLKPAAAVVNQPNSIYAYIASSTATGANTNGTGVLDIINIATPQSMAFISQVPAPNTSILLSFDISGATLLAAGNTTGNRNPGNPTFGFTGNLTITTMDITNVTIPTVLASYDTGIQVNGTFYTAAFANGIFAIVSNAPITDPTGPQSLMIVDARRPANPVIYPFRTQFGFSGLVPTSGGYLLAPDSLGLNIYQLTLR